MRKNHPFRTLLSGIPQHSDAICRFWAANPSSSIDLNIIRSQAGTRDLCTRAGLSHCMRTPLSWPQVLTCPMMRTASSSPPSLRRSTIETYPTRSRDTPQLPCQATPYWRGVGEGPTVTVPTCTDPRESDPRPGTPYEQTAVSISTIFYTEFTPPSNPTPASSRPPPRHIDLPLMRQTVLYAYMSSIRPGHNLLYRPRVLR